MRDTGQLARRRAGRGDPDEDRGRPGGGGGADADRAEQRPCRVPAASAVGSIDIPAISGAVLAWAVVWFGLGYALYATVFGALGSLGSRAEDAQAVAGPAQIVLLVAYFASFFMITQPASAAAKAISYFPLTAPLAMPGRIAMGATSWWEPVLAVAITLATIIGLVVLAGRLYTNAILHSGPRLSLQYAWRRTITPGPSAAGVDAHPPGRCCAGLAP